MKIVEEVLAGNRLSLARLLTHVEMFDRGGMDALDELFKHTGKARLIGVTGAPGTGKSSLVNQLALFFRRHSVNGVAARVGVVAVDPSSPFTGGALLGDRIRMRDLSGDPGVFIRSMASRCALGGLARATFAVTQVLDAAGFDIILIETVGVGQSEIDIARLAHTVLVVEAPGMGDEVQTAKAGILEIADILVVNKADLPGADKTSMALRGMLEIAYPSIPNGIHHFTTGQDINYSQEGQNWIPPVLKTASTTGTGLKELVDTIQLHWRHLDESGNITLRVQSRLKTELDDLLKIELVKNWRSCLPEGLYGEVFNKLWKREISPNQAVGYLTRDQNADHQSAQVS